MIDEIFGMLMRPGAPSRRGFKVVNVGTPVIEGRRRRTEDARDSPSRFLDGPSVPVQQGG